MNNRKEARLFEELAAESTKIVSEIPKEVKSYLLQIHKISTFANRLPAIAMHRKFNLQKLIRDTLLNLDSVAQELKKTSFDCTMQSLNLKRAASHEEHEEVQRNKLKRQAKTRSTVLQTIENDDEFEGEDDYEE